LIPFYEKQGFVK